MWHEIIIGGRHMSGIGITDTVNKSGYSAIYEYQATRTNFQTKNSGDTEENSFSRVVASRENLWEARTISSVQNGLSTTLSDLDIAKASFDIVKSNIEQIQQIVDDAYNGVLTGTDLDNAQNDINSLVDQIDEIVASTTLNGQSLFDGSFAQIKNTGLPNSDSYNLDFTNNAPSTVGAPDFVRDFIAPNGDIDDSLRIRYADDQYIVASAPRNNNSDPEGTNDMNGSVYIFDAQTNNLIREIVTPDNTTVNQQFGDSVDIENGKILIGADGNVNESQGFELDHDFVGAAYLFDISTGALETTFTEASLKSDNDVNPDSNSDGDMFGAEVALKDGIAYINATKHTNSNGTRGAIFRFESDGTFLNKIEAPNGTTGFFGSDFEVTDDFILSSNIVANNIEGEFQVLDKTTGNLIRTITSATGATGAAGEKLGTSFSVFGDKVLIGAPGNYASGTNPAPGYGGRAYIYDNTTGELDKELTTPSALANQDRFGEYVKLTGNYALVTASGGGASYIFDPDSGDLVFEATGVTADVNPSN